MIFNRIFVTGGAGYVGAVLVPRLLSEGYEVTVLDLMIYGEEVLRRHPKLSLIRGDIRDKKSLNKAMKGTNAVIHLAYINGTKFFYTKPILTLDIAMKGIINVIDLCIKNKSLWTHI